MENKTRAIQRRIDMDLLRRSSAGIAIYFIIFPVILYPPGLYESHPSLSYGLTIAMSIVCALRLIHRLLTKRFYERMPKFWMGLFCIFASVQGAMLGCFFAYVIHDLQLNAVFQVTMFVVAGMASGALSALSPNKLVALIYPQALLLPGIVVTFYDGHQTSQAVVMALYLVYLSLIGVLFNKEYIRTFSIEAQLESQKKELETLSRTDGLTGIFNRGYFNSILEMQWDSGIRNNIGLTMMMIDIDLFKKVNDQYGHPSGDECIIRVAKMLSNFLHRKTDIICRYGGEEFAVLLGGTPTHDAERIGEEIRKEVEATWIEYGEHKFKITVSIGIASLLPKIGSQPSLLMDQADQALYNAKKGGRNCVKVFRRVEL